MYTKYARLRDKKGYTDFKVCTLTGIAPTTMSVDKLQKIAKLFKVKIEDLI